MSYNGTVRCSYCYQTGHNRRKCEKLTNDLKRAYTAHGLNVEEARTKIAEGDTSKDWVWALGYWTNRQEQARQDYMKRTKIDLATGQKVTNKMAKSARMKNVTCGYCGERGHTRRTCQNVKNDYAVFVEATRRVREAWLEELKQSGCGIGSMVIKKTHGYNKANEWGPITITGLITEIEWYAIDAHNVPAHAIVAKSNDEINGRKARYGSDGRNGIGRLPLDWLTGHKSEHADYTCLPSNHTPEPPSDWFTKMRDIKSVFSTSDERPSSYKYDSSDRWHTQVREELGLPTCAYSDA